MNHKSTVFVVDDDQDMRTSLRWLIESVGLYVETYSSAADFLSNYDTARPGCLVVDVRMPGMSGLELQEKFAAQNASIPIIVITGHGDVAMAVRAMKTGAVDFIEKPFNDQILLDRIQQAIDKDAETRLINAEYSTIAARIASLTPREREVMEFIVAGRLNKQVAADLDISIKTVEVHRAKIMEKMEAGTLPKLVEMVLRHKGKP
ncbi:MAG: response regulator transcription factor [Gammaproteobacteria bacterium]|nr:response regulator transcription factor [Gammaproteobacteria bacterium]